MSLCYHGSEQYCFNGALHVVRYYIAQLSSWKRQRFYGNYHAIYEQAPKASKKFSFVNIALNYTQPPTLCCIIESKFSLHTLCASSCIVMLKFPQHWNFFLEARSIKSCSLELNLIKLLYFFSLIAVDSRHLKECIERAEFSLNLELWFGEQQQQQQQANQQQNGLSQQLETTSNELNSDDTMTTLTLASTRILQLNFHPARGLHYHLPVLFDYFHLAGVSLGIHASLIALHQPYIKWVYPCSHS